VGGSAAPPPPPRPVPLPEPAEVPPARRRRARRRPEARGGRRGKASLGPCSGRRCPRPPNVPVARNGRERGRGGERGAASLWAGRARPPIGCGARARRPIGKGREREGAARRRDARARGGERALRGASAAPLRRRRRHLGWRLVPGRGRSGGRTGGRSPPPAVAGFRGRKSITAHPSPLSTLYSLPSGYRRFSLAPRHFKKKE